MFGINNIT